MNRKTNTHQKLGFDVPKNYFDNSKAQILAAIQTEKTNKTRVRKLIPKMIPIAAVLVLALATTWFLRVNSSNSSLSELDVLFLDSLTVEEEYFEDWYEENYVLNDLD
jgi:cation transport ATPase